MSAQIIEIGGQKMAVLPVGDYERLLEVAEDKFDLASAIVAERRREGGEEYIPAELVDRILAGQSALRVWRQHRKLSLVELGAKAGISVSYLSDIERGLKKGSARHWAKLAQVLGVAVEDILPQD
jgi:DNA-binding Xre family transcriptional regulator